MENTIKNIANLKKLLPHGSLKEIAKMSDTTIFTVSRVFNGKSKNIKVVRAIGDYIKNIKTDTNEIEQFIKMQGGSENE